MSDGYDDRNLLSLLTNGDKRAFEVIYDRFADRLYWYVYSRTRVKEICEEIVQEIFVSLWVKRESLEITNTLDSYLYGAAKHKILSYIRTNDVRKKYAADFVRFAANRVDNSSEELLELKDLQHTIDESISKLPEKCQRAFRMSRMEHETIQHIADRMNISTRTVENYISTALRHLRTSLGNLLGVIILLLYG